MTVPIEPGTKVGALLEAYPGIEDALIRWVPAFEKLRNPILRKTVAKFATLAQAARIGGVEVRDLVRKLREATGQSGGEGACGGGESPVSGATEAPGWVGAARIALEIDAEAILEKGLHPIGAVREGIGSLVPGGVVLLRSSFIPEPLIDYFRKEGLLVYSNETEPGRHETYIRRPG